MRKIFLKLIPLTFLIIFSPFLAYAQADSCFAVFGITKTFCQIQTLLNLAIPLLVSLGVVYFVWGVVRYMIGDAEEAKTKGRDQIIYGIIGLTVIVGLWGLVNIVVKTFVPGNSSAPTTELITPIGSCTLNNPNFPDLVNYVTGCIINNSIIPLIFALAVLFFIWGAVKFLIIGADDEKNRSEGRQFMVWGIIALAMMLSVWGLVGILRTTFGINTGSFLPQVKP